MAIKGVTRSGRGKESCEVASGVAELSWYGSVATLFLDGVESSCIDVDHPERLEFEYMQHMDVACEVFCGVGSSIRALHLGGAAAALPWSWALTRPQSRQTVVEIDPLMIEVVRRWFDLPRAPELKMRCDDGRHALDTTREGSWDVIVRDAFADGLVPAHLATVEAGQAAARALRPGGLYVVNAAHGGGVDARREVQGLIDAFDVVCAVVDPKVGKGGRRGNVVFVCVSHNQADVSKPDESQRHDEEIGEKLAQMDRLLRRLPLPARLMSGDALRRWQAGASSLRDEEVGWTPLPLV